MPSVLVNLVDVERPAYCQKAVVLIEGDVVDGRHIEWSCSKKGMIKDMCLHGQAGSLDYTLLAIRCAEWLK